MIDVQPTFLHFISDNLIAPATVHVIRTDSSDPSARLLQTNAVNIQFLGIKSDFISTQTVVIDVLNDDESTARGWVQQVATLLRAAYYTPMYDYTVPAAPVAVGNNVMWDRKKVDFRRILSDYYVHYSCALPLQYIS